MNGRDASTYVTNTQVVPSTVHAGYALQADQALNAAAFDGMGSGDFVRKVDITPESTRLGYAKYAVQADTALNFMRGILEYRRPVASGIITPGNAFGTTAYYNKMIVVYPDDVVAAPTMPYFFFAYNWPVGTEVWWFNAHETRVILFYDEGSEGQYTLTCATPAGPGRLGGDTRGWHLQPRGTAFLKSFFDGDDGTYQTACKVMMTGDIVTAT